MERPRSERGPWAGWLAFAAIMLALIGTFNLIDGLAALFNDNYFAVADSDLLAFDYTTWGVIQLIGGVLLLVAAWGLTAGEGWARWIAVVVAALNAIAHVSFLSAYPLWSLLIITLDIVVIYALTVRWHEASDLL